MTTSSKPFKVKTDDGTIYNFGAIDGDGFRDVGGGSLPFARCKVVRLHTLEQMELLGPSGQCWSSPSPVRQVSPIFATAASAT